MTYHSCSPPLHLSPLVHSLWSFHSSEEEFTTTILPDGMFDVIFSVIAGRVTTIVLTGIWTRPKNIVVQPKVIYYGIRFRLLAAEYIVEKSVAGIVNSEIKFDHPILFSELRIVESFRFFCESIWAELANINLNIDGRKLQFSNLVYSTNGSISIMSLQKKAEWNARSILRYLRTWLGVSTKEYLQITRFKDALKDVMDEEVPDSFFDQAHFIRAVSTYSGQTPKRLARSTPDRFIQLGTRRRP